MMVNVTEELARLTRMRDEGIMSDAEFEAQKAILLKSNPWIMPAKKSGGVAKYIAFGCLGLIGLLFLLGAIGAIVAAGDKALPDNQIKGTPTPTASIQSPEVARKLFLTFRSDLMTKMKLCDDAGEKAEQALKGVISQGDVVTAYEIADVAESTCSQVSRVVVDLEISPEIPSKAAELSRSARSVCSNAAVTRQSQLSTLKTIIDGDDKPSTIAGYRAQADRVTAANLLCVSKLFMAADAVGLKAEDLK